MDVDTDIRRLRRQLADLIDDSGASRRQIDRQLGQAEGYLSQLLAGTIDLKFWHLIDILETLGCSPSLFFERVFPSMDPQAAAASSPALDAALSVDRDVVGVYHLGIEAVRELRQRLERCEAALFGRPDS